MTDLCRYRRLSQRQRTGLLQVRFERHTEAILGMLEAAAADANWTLAKVRMGHVETG